MTPPKLPFPNPAKPPTVACRMAPRPGQMSDTSNITGGDGPTEDPDTVRVAALQKRVGDRVRHLRELRGLPRRALSERSGVSPRYLAQLEAGEGNISIGLLKRVAVALDHKIEWLVSEEDTWTSDALRVADLFRQAPEAVRQQCLDILTTASVADSRASRLALVGLRGAGKSTLGALLGQAFAVPFVELNRDIESHSGMTVTDILALYGQEGYRRLEALALDRVIASHDTVVLAVAGGIVAEPETYKTLLARFHTVWIKADPQEHMDRVRAQGDTRPMAGNPEAMAQLRSILKSREALYEQAHVHLDTAGRRPDQSLSDLAALVRNSRFLQPQ